MSELVTPICTYVEEMTLKFITGAESLDQFDEFRAVVESMGIEEALQLEQEGFEAYQSKTTK